MSTLKQKILKNANHIENKNDLQSVLQYLNFIHDKEAWGATMEILKDKKSMKKIKQGLDDMKNGRVYDFDVIKRNV